MNDPIDVRRQRSRCVDRGFVSVNGVTRDAVRENTGNRRNAAFAFAFLREDRVAQPQPSMIRTYDVCARDLNRSRMAVSARMLHFRNGTFAFRTIGYNDEAIDDDISNALDWNDVTHVIFFGINGSNQMKRYCRSIRYRDARGGHCLGCE